MADDFDSVDGGYVERGGFDREAEKIKEIERELRELNRTAGLFSRTITGAFAASITGARGFDDVLKGLYLRLSDLALRVALKPVESALSSGLSRAFGGLLGVGGGTSVAAATGAVKPFAAGGIIGTPTYFPLSSGGLGLAGEAGPEAIMPLTRTANGRLGVAADGGARAPLNVVVNIATPDSDSFRRSEIYLTGQIARAVARGQRGL
jgi:phage-related minor tail protein